MTIIIPRYNLDWSTGKVFGKDLITQVDIDSDGYIIEKYRLYHHALETDDKQLFADLIADDTVYAYATLRWNGKPIRMKYYQDAIINDTHKRIDVEAANQQGKSFSLCVKASCKFLQDHDKNTYIGLISKSQAQNGMNMRMVRSMIKNSPFSYEQGGNDNMTVMVQDFPLKDEKGNIVKKNGKPVIAYSNTLVCSVASTGALGYPFDWLLLDEFEFWENPEGLEYMYDQVLEPRTFHTQGQIVIYSNPNGKNYVSENLHKRKIDNEYQFHTYNINFLDNPSNTREYWELKKQHVHPIIFASTMAAERTESEGAALTEKDIQKCIDPELNSIGFHGINKTESWWFLDLGFVNDQNALVGCFKGKNDEGKDIYNFVLKLYPQNHDTAELWGMKESDEESVPQIVNRFGGDGALFDMDLTGKEGNEVNAHNAGLMCSGVKMSGPWKARWYDRFISLVKQGRIRVQITDNWIDGQNKNFIYQARSLRISTKMPDGRTRPYPLYHHTNEKDHDDILDAVVGCLSMADDELTDGPSYDMQFVETGFGNKRSGVINVNTDNEPHTFDEFCKTQEIPKFINKRDLYEWYMKRYGEMNNG